MGGGLKVLKTFYIKIYVIIKRNYILRFTVMGCLLILFVSTLHFPRGGGTEGRGRDALGVKIEGYGIEQGKLGGGGMFPFSPLIFDNHNYFQGSTHKGEGGIDR